MEAIYEHVVLRVILTTLRHLVAFFFAEVGFLLAQWSESLGQTQDPKQTDVSQAAISKILLKRKKKKLMVADRSMPRSRAEMQS